MSVGVAGLLSGLLNSGWESDTLQEHSLTRPNEGIRRSWYNAVIAAALLGSIGGVMSGIVCGISFGLIGQLPGWPVLAGGFAIAFGIIFSFYFLMIRGGIAFLEHYLLRYHLWRSGVIPLRYVHFLNYAANRILLHSIGGGYMFVHRLFLDYFASGQKNPDRKGKNEYGR